MQIVLDVALPVFALIGAGWLAGWRKVLGSAASEALNSFVYWFALPAVLFLGMARRPLEDIFNMPFIGAFLGGMLFVYAAGGLIGWLVKRERAEIHAMQALTACFSNTGYMGIPLFLAAFGPDRLLPAILATVIMSAIMVGIGVVSLELARNAKHGLGRGLRDAARAVIRNPLVVSTFAGLLWNVTGLPKPQSLITFCELMGAAAGPCALFAIGLFLAGRPLRVNWGEVSWLAALKLVLQPLATWLLMVTVFPLDPFWGTSALLLAALPTGALTFVVAQRYGVYVERTSQAILLSTIISLPTLSVLLVLLPRPS